MKPIRRILVCVKDPAHGMTPAAGKAAQLARALGAELELFHAITTPIYMDNYTYSDWSLSEAKRDLLNRRTEQLQYLANGLQGEGRRKKLSISVQTTWDWPSYASIVRRVRSRGTDLVVADRHAGRHFARSILHYSDWELMRLCPTPLLLVGGKDTYERPAILTAVDPGHAWDKPAALDARILELGAQFHGALQGPLHAVHAFESVPIGPFSIEAMSARLVQEMVDRRRATAISQFRRLMRGTHITRARQHLVDAPPVTGISQVARDLKADIVVLGVVSRSGLKRLLIGGTAEALLDRLNSDLLVVKPAQFKERVPRAKAGARVIPALPPIAP